MRELAAGLAAAIALAGAAEAATMTFDGIDDYVTTWTEDGITATADGQIGSFGTPGTAHLDSGGTGYASQVAFTMAVPFDAESVEVVPVGSNYVRCDAEGACETLSYDNVLVSGYSGGELVAQDAFDMFAVNGTYSFGEEFSDLDALVIAFAPLPFVGTAPDGSEYFCADPTCSHFDIDDVTLAPVPLPATAGLLGIAALALGTLGRRRRPA